MQYKNTKNGIHSKMFQKDETYHLSE